jgi:heterogeneous nuclear ribonucleoprotein G
MNNILFIDGLPAEMSNTRLIALFSPFGSVVVSTVARRAATEYLPFGFVSMQSEAEAKNAQANLNGCVIDGNPIRVDSRISPPFGWSKKQSSFRKYSPHNHRLTSFHR